MDVVFRQRMLACAGFYTGKIDGAWGQKSKDADAAFMAEYLKLQAVGGKFDPRTEAVIATLLPKAQEMARAFMRVAGPDCKLLSGTRTYAEQDALYAQGRTKPGSIVTKARGGSSNHNFCVAWDVGIFHGTDYLEGNTVAEDAAYAALAKRIKAAIPNIEWGGDWHSIKDKPHYQYPVGNNMAQIRAKFEAGKLTA